MPEERPIETFLGHHDERRASMPVAVYFDLDGTLLTYAHPFEELFARTVPDGTAAMQTAFSNRLLTALEDLESDPYEAAFQFVCDTYDVEGTPTELAAAYVRRELAATRVSAQATRLVAAVTARHPTGILTNGDGPMQRAKLDRHGLDELVDAIIVSNELGVRKPDPAIFAAAKRRLPADTYVYVGDTVDEDVRPADEQGFATVHIGTGEATADVTAGSIEDLAAVLTPLLAACERGSN